MIINNKSLLFNSWLKQYQGAKRYVQLVRDKFFNQRTATSLENKARFFIINLPATHLDIGNTLDLALLISKKFSNRASSRTPDTDRYCPYLHFSNTNETMHKDLKLSLRASSIIFLDGHDFKGSDFYVDSILKTPTSHINIQLKLIDEIDDLNTTLQAPHRRAIEVFEFYHNTPIAGLVTPSSALYAAIKVDSIEEIKEILK